MKKLLLLCLLLAASALLAQNARKDDVVFTRIGSPAPGASIAVCTQPCTVPAAVSLSNLPSPLAAICSSSSDVVCIQTNPVTADGLGNYSFYIAPGKYTLVFFGSGLTQRTQTDQILACDPTNCKMNGAITGATFDTAGAGNIFKINGTTVNAVTGTGATAVLSAGPTFTGTTTLGAATFNNTAITFPSPWGVTLKKGSAGANYTTTSAAYSDIDGTNLAFTVTVPTGWKASVVAAMTGAESVAANAFVAITDGTTVLTEAYFNSASFVGIPLAWVLTGDGASHTFKLRFKSDGANTLTITNNSTTVVPTMLVTLIPSN